ncbi:hypothetical protein [Silvibacterium acidisoli]|uniref:hypothetical protein n=1 Tax=Acidobacteriaceae bacterium ZG23-2 TaxID=2883246 RepID=UPI00406D3702
MAQVLDSDGHVIGTILAMNGTLTMIPTITGDAADKLKQSFQAWKNQGGEKALYDQSASKNQTSAKAGISNSSPAKPAAVVTSDSQPAAEPQPGGQSGRGILHVDDLDRLENATLRFDLNAMRSAPALLEQKPVMQYFIAVNNCRDSAVQRSLQDELDYPELARFYSAKAPEILSGLPDTAGLLMFRGNTRGELIWGRAAGGYDPTLKTLVLGEYDVSRKAFPILVSDKSKTLEISGTQRADVNRISLETSCPVAYSALMRLGANASLPASYTVTVQPMSFGELPMSEADARRYIDSVNAAQRDIVLAVDVHLKQNPQETNAKVFAYDGTIARVIVLNKASFQQIGTLYDDHTLAPVRTKEIPSAITTMKSTREFNEELITAVYVSLAASSCGWPISADQKANLDRYISDVNTYGKFNDRSSLNGVAANIRNSINDPSRHFCENPSERQDFNRRVATVWPNGPMAAPPPQTP